ncbi:transcriptional regulator family: Centromere protein B DNA-binding region [Penicillium cosmopolitanum]|uniref:Transcriptional regulator family: Centromere protein B DNA-binding region n=1 Tax=Penicillium cosmopolitanum TaxID=1131564 RepID=A0A9W9SK66_9EURO|nr:transcriptional regulator family: Centromere protein B DNA-binding region [Penicillium cosmopolitanum]KAJ5379244.1 transcriptional regulator family: Centromere protein B DNA-binding region [Penicillium cosmopolitanum]
MPYRPKIDESRVAEACEAASLLENPNLSQIARQYGVSYGVLRGRIRQGKQPRTAPKPENRALDNTQEEALILWIVELNKYHMPVTPALLHEMAQLSLVRAGSDHILGDRWAYRFIKRLPEDVKLSPVKQRTKEYKRIKAEDAWKLDVWYMKLKNVIKKNTPARLVYNFDECGFQPGKGKNRKVLGQEGGPDLGENEHSETITALECIAADGWFMDPLFVFKGTTFQEVWYDNSEGLPPRTLTAVSPNGWISDELLLEWLGHFQEATKERVEPNEKRIMIFDGHNSHLTVEFLEKCQEYEILPIAFEPHTTHISQPLDGKPFLAYKQHFKVVNNEMSYFAGMPAGKSEFLRVITRVRARTFNTRIIRDSFTERGIFPVNGKDIVKKLRMKLPISSEDLDIDTSQLRLHGEEHTPPPPEPGSSSIENSPPKSIQAAKRNHRKLEKLFRKERISPKLQRGLNRVLKHQGVIIEHAALTKDIVRRISAARRPLQRQFHKRQVKPLSGSNILSVRDANYSIKARKEKEATKVAKQAAKRIGHKLNQPTATEVSQAKQASLDAEKAAREGGLLFWFDSNPVR